MQTNNSSNQTANVSQNDAQFNFAAAMISEGTCARHIASLSDEAKADIAAGEWDEVSTDLLYVCVGAISTDDMAEARRLATEIAAK